MKTLKNIICDDVCQSSPACGGCTVLSDLTKLLSLKKEKIPILNDNSTFSDTFELSNGNVKSLRRYCRKRRMKMARKNLTYTISKIMDGIFVSPKCVRD